MKKTEQGIITANNLLQKDYYQIDIRLDEIPGNVKPGQFTHIQIPDFKHRILRRPFSVFNTDPDKKTISIVYKVVGEGTKHLSTISPKTKISVLGPLGNSFSVDQNKYPLIVAGGYGAAATYMLAKHSEKKGTFLMGGKDVSDLILLKEFKETGFATELATENGSLGHKGLVTDILKKELRKYSPEEVIVYTCGPNPMLKAISEITSRHKIETQVSLDEKMCCGLGACFACVVKIKSKDGNWEYKRACKDGPVFAAEDVYWDDET
ncbi:MAG: dihydroorotate dehydrogenase electron transfer subunit [Verrucomicrobiota bacterium]|nr:dihydroorotate dehydrogenase electron transfer subunit [Verrucomicrobiota bacterium]